MRTFTLNEDKFKELMLYVVYRGANDPALGATKLNKLLFYCDFAAYALWGEPITGATYQHLNYGPAPRRLESLRNQLLEGGDAVMVRVPYGYHAQDRLQPLREPRLDVFTANEISLVDRVMESFKGENARQISELSHHEVGWQLTNYGEVIPYETVFVTDDPLPEAASGWAAEALRNLGYGDAIGDASAIAS